MTADRTAPRCRHCHHPEHPEGPCPCYVRSLDRAFADRPCGCSRNEPLLLPGVHILTR